VPGGGRFGGGRWPYGVVVPNSVVPYPEVVPELGVVPYPEVVPELAAVPPPALDPYGR
jgi:hypothetical protein